MDVGGTPQQGVVNREERCEFTGGDRVCLLDKHRNSIAATDFKTEQNTSISDTFKMSKVLTGRVGQNGNVGSSGKTSWEKSLDSQFLEHSQSIVTRVSYKE